MDGIDELIFLGDLFDFLFGLVGDAVDASDGLLRLIAEKLPGKRLVFLAGNHDHQVEIAYPTCVQSSDDSRTRYWNTGSWIYEPDLGSRQAYARYLRYAWPGTAVVIDDEEPEPRLVELLADLNPLHGGPGLPSA